MEYFSGMTLEQVFSQNIQFKIEDKQKWRITGTLVNGLYDMQT